MITWNDLPQEERFKLIPIAIQAQILHIQQCKQIAIKNHREHMKMLDSWLKNLNDDLSKYENTK